MTDRFSNFADLAEHYAREIATPDYAAAFMEQTELAKLSIEHEPSAAEMPDPEVAQAAIEMMLATVFDLFRVTRMEDMASEVAWGIANSFHVVAKRLDTREDSMANRLQEKRREYDPSEVYATDLEDLTMQARSLAECRDAMECMRDHAAKIYLVETGRPFSPVRGSRVSSKTNASMIEARDYLAAQKAQRREQFAPTGPVVVFSGGQQFTDIAQVEDYLNAIRTRIPSMVLATTAQNKGADVIAAAWASSKNVPVILCKPDASRGPSAPYQRNARMLSFKPVEAVVCSGGGIQANLADRLREARVPMHIVREAGGPFLTRAKLGHLFGGLFNDFDRRLPMNALTTALDIPAFDPISYDAALRAATVRAQHSFFDQHVIEDDEGCFVAIDEGDYNALPQHLIDRIVHTVPGMMADDFDEANIARAASFMSVVMDPEWDADCPF